MQRPRNRNILASAALVLAACSAQAETPLQVPPGFQYFSNCSEQTALLSYSHSRFADILPPGWTFPGNLASVHVSGSICADGGDGHPTEELITFLEVVPPVALQTPGILAYAILLGAVTESPRTLASFTAFGFGDRIELGSVEVTASSLLGVSSGRTRVSAASFNLTTNTVTLGPTLQFAGAHVRLYRVDNRVATHVIEGTYSAQTAKVGTGTVVQTGNGFLPLPIGVAVSSHAYGYDLSIEPGTLP